MSRCTQRFTRMFEHKEADQNDYLPDGKFIPRWQKEGSRSDG